MAFSEGAVRGAAVTGNPFSVFISRVEQARAREMKNQQAVEKDARDLKNLLTQLGVKHEQDKALLDIQARQKKEQATHEGLISGDIDEIPTTGANGVLGQAGITPQAQGTTLTKEPRVGVSDSINVQGEEPKEDITQPRTDTVTIDGTPFLRTESTKRLKERLQLEKLRREFDPEFQRKEFERELGEKGELNEQKLEFETNKLKNKNRETARVQSSEIDNMIESLFSISDKLIPAQEGGRSSVVEGAKRSGGATLFGRLISPSEESEDARSFKQSIEAIATPLIRSLGEKGMLTNQDIKRSLNLLPKFDDSIRGRNTNRKILGDFLKSKVNAHFETIGLELESVGTSVLEESKEGDLSKMSDEELNRRRNELLKRK